jgi:predicted Zn-dependent protease
VAGNSGASSFDFFSTHPRTADRVAVASQIAAKYSKNEGRVNRDGHLAKLNGLVYGDSSSQGFVRGQSFYHPSLGFTFTVPNGYNIVNSSSEVVASNKSLGTAIVFDAVGDKSNPDALTYLTKSWLNGKDVANAERIKVNGLSGATAAFSGTVNGSAANIRVVAIEWKPGMFFRFMIAIPPSAGSKVVTDLRKATYSFRKMSASEKASVKPPHIRLVTARAGDTSAKMAASMPFDSYKVERFRVLNGLKAGQEVVAGRKYKVIVK